jgi:2-(1,2-epoxy-1,2-dihydrophenyl)acetyl-CoA isomerase
MTQYATITLERADGLATLTLNRPEQRNGMTNRMVCETYQALRDVAADGTTRVLVLTGAGESFCPGADLNWATSDNPDPADSAPADALSFQVPVLLHEMPAVTVAAVNGACAGAGMGWACGADIRLATKRARFNTAFINVAFAGDMGIPWSLSRLVGAAKARELSFLADKFDAQTAQEIGLVARVFDDDEFATQTQNIVQGLLARSPVALKTLKAHYVAAERMSFGDYVELETQHHKEIGTMADTQEAFRAFLEKRPPVFTGK